VSRGFELAINRIKPREGDWIIVSDMDELVRSRFVETLKNPDPLTEVSRRLLEGYPQSDGDIIRITCLYYMFSYEFKLQRSWEGPLVVRYRPLDSPVWKDRQYPNLSTSR